MQPLANTKHEYNANDIIVEIKILYKLLPQYHGVSEFLNALNKTKGTTHNDDLLR